MGQKLFKLSTGGIQNTDTPYSSYKRKQYWCTQNSKWFGAIWLDGDEERRYRENNTEKKPWGENFTIGAILEKYKHLSSTP